MYYAITTKYLGYTNTKPSRIKAETFVGNTSHSVTLEYSHSLSETNNHIRAAKALAEKLAWSGTWYQGALPKGYAFVRSRTPGDEESAFYVPYDAKAERDALAKL